MLLLVILNSIAFVNTFTFVSKIHEGFRKSGVGVKDDIAIVTLSKEVDE